MNLPPFIALNFSAPRAGKGMCLHGVELSPRLTRQRGGDYADNQSSYSRWG